MGRSTGLRTRTPLPALIQRLATQLLILDHSGLVTLAADQAHEVLDVLEDRNGIGSTLIVTQLPVAPWHGRIGDPTIAAAILDRLVHAAHRIELRGRVDAQAARGARRIGTRRG